MPSIVQIIKSQDLLGSKDYTRPENCLHSMFLFSEKNPLSSDTLLELGCSVSVEDLGYTFGTPENPRDPIHLGFAATQNKTASLNVYQIAESIHNVYDGSTDIVSVFTDLFPNISGELYLHNSKEAKNCIRNQQWYQYGPVEQQFQNQIQEEYSSIMGQELLPF